MFKGFYIFRSGGHLVWQSKTLCASLEQLCEIIINLDQQLVREEMPFKDFLVYTL